MTWNGDGNEAVSKGKSRGSVILFLILSSFALAVIGASYWSVTHPAVTEPSYRGVLSSVIPNGGNPPTVILQFADGQIYLIVGGELAANPVSIGQTVCVYDIPSPHSFKNVDGIAVSKWSIRGC